MKKLKVYLDSSIISHLYADDVPEKMRITKIFWDAINNHTYEAVISQLVYAELKRCNEPKRSLMLDQIKKSNINEIEITTEITDLADKYINFGVLSEKHYEDALHIAAASIERCDILASWNFKHIVRIKTILGANGINRAEGYGVVQLLSPDALVEEGDEE